MIAGLTSPRARVPRFPEHGWGFCVNTVGGGVWPASGVAVRTNAPGFSSLTCDTGFS